MPILSSLFSRGNQQAKGYSADQHDLRDLHRSNREPTGRVSNHADEANEACNAEDEHVRRNEEGSSPTTGFGNIHREEG